MDTTPHGPELHLDVFNKMSILLYRAKLHLNVSTPHGPELHMDVAAQQEPLLLMDLAAQQEPLLLLDVPLLQRHVLHLDQQNRGMHLDVSGQQEPVLGWTCLYHRGLSCTWRCLDFRSLC